MNNFVELKFYKMGIPSFFRTYKHKVFEYRPRYYDENKEELDNIIKNAELEKGIKKEGEFKRSITRGSFRENRINVKQTNFQSTIRLIIILLILFVIVGYLYFLFIKN